MSDAYERMGEFHDLFMDGAWERVRPVLAEAFGDIGSDAVILDLGAGTGIGTRALARCTAAQIVAVEPSLTMRAVLTARVSDDPDLASRVSVLSGSAPGVLDELGGPLAGFVCAHMLGHLTDADRAATFAGLNRLLTHDAVGVVVVDPLPAERYERSGKAPEVDERQIGSHRYTARHLPADEGDGYVSEYAVVEGVRVLRRERFTGSWYSLTLADLASELAPHGSVVEQRLPGVGLLRPA